MLVRNAWDYFLIVCHTPAQKVSQDLTTQMHGVLCLFVLKSLAKNWHTYIKCSWVINNIRVWPCHTCHDESSKAEAPSPPSTTTHSLHLLFFTQFNHFKSILHDQFKPFPFEFKRSTASFTAFLTGLRGRQSLGRTCRLRTRDLFI